MQGITTENMYRLALAAVFWFATVPVRAEERIIEFDSHIAVAADGLVTVTEAITVRADGEKIRRGIYRELQTARERVGFTVVAVKRDGMPESWFVDREPGRIRIYMGQEGLS